MDRRSHPRQELFAQVQLSRANEVYVMSTDNISAGGIFVHGNPSEHPQMTIGAEVELLLFHAEGLMLDLTCRAKIMRLELSSTHGRSGFGLKFTGLDERNRGRLEQLLSGKAPPTVPPRGKAG